jgi:hypothetical protein
LSKGGEVGEVKEMFSLRNNDRTLASRGPVRLVSGEQWHMLGLWGDRMLGHFVT